MFQAVVFNVLVASPSDTQSERAHAIEALNQWNADMSLKQRVVLRPLMWEFGAPMLRQGSDPQAELNWMVDEADSLVGFLNARIGTTTARAASGTIEEIDRAMARGIPVHLFISNAPIPRDAKVADIEAFRTAEERYRGLGVVGYFNDRTTLDRMLRSSIERDVTAATMTSAPAVTSALGASVTRNRAGTAVATIENKGTSLVSGVGLRLRLSDGTIERLDVRPGLELRPRETYPLDLPGRDFAVVRGGGIEATWRSGRASHSAYLPF